MLQNKAGFRIRLHPEKVFVRGWEMVPKVHRFQEVGLAFVRCSPQLKLLDFLKSPFTHKKLLKFHVPGIYLPPRARCYQLVHRPHLLPHSVKRLLLLWSGHRGASKQCR